MNKKQVLCFGVTLVQINWAGTCHVKAGARGMQLPWQPNINRAGLPSQPTFLGGGGHKSLQMYGAFLNLRFRDTIDDICESLSELLRQPGMLHAVVSQTIHRNTDNNSLSITSSSNNMAPHHRHSMLAVAQSSASTPSLRSRDGTLPPHMKMVDGGGNVKVVVRVRAFLPRGMLAYILLYL